MLGEGGVGSHGRRWIDHLLALSSSLSSSSSLPSSNFPTSLFATPNVTCASRCFESRPPNQTHTPRTPILAPLHLLPSSPPLSFLQSKQSSSSRFSSPATSLLNSLLLHAFPPRLAPPPLGGRGHSPRSLRLLLTSFLVVRGGTSYAVLPTYRCGEQVLTRFQTTFSSSLFTSNISEQYLPLHSHIHLTLQRRRERRSSVPHVTFLPATAKEGGGEGGGRRGRPPPSPSQVIQRQVTCPSRPTTSFQSNPRRVGEWGGRRRKGDHTSSLTNSYSLLTSPSSGKGGCRIAPCGVCGEHH